ncbi:hypothetical protein [Speluncibacter jeojiensis]|uniref:Secreted protein n=1 Tax=Speluncibacter jeojiensis TaxID=2710754 RepID=A0A9X4M0V5_9ACTN|nr:hypothetical protein [Corynebacteriales bacterium D3-21]
MRKFDPRKAAAAVAVAAAVPVLFAGAAHADTPGTVYFSDGIFNCSIDDAGVVGCDLTSPSNYMSINLGSGSSDLTVPFPVDEVVIDVPWAPAHPAFDIGTPHTLPGGNPDISTVGHPSGTGPTAGVQVSHAGSSCQTGFHGSFSCDAMGHSFTYYEIITAN